MIIDDKFKNLHEKLNKDFSWPSEYMFKFIVPSENTEALATLISHFPSDTDISYKQSSSAKYLSITIKEHLNSADHVIEKYQKIATIPGVISL